MLRSYSFWSGRRYVGSAKFVNAPVEIGQFQADFWTPHSGHRRLYSGEFHRVCGQAVELLRHPFQKSFEDYNPVALAEEVSRLR